MIFNNHLLYIRTKLNLSIKEAASSAGVSAIKLRAWETGRSRPSISSLLKLERAYKLPYGTLLDSLCCVTEKKRIYISHRLRNDKTGEELNSISEQNRKKVSVICQQILELDDDILILSPIHAFGFCPIEGDQSLVIEQCKSMIELADEMWVYGDWQNSVGSRTEIQYAKILKIPIRFMSH